MLSMGLGGCTMQTETDFSSVPDGLNIPGDQGLPAWYYEMEMAYEKGLMATKPEPPPKIKEPDAPGSAPTMDGYFDQRYREHYAYYRKAMEVYLLKTLRLDVYDKQVEDSGLSFVPIPEISKGQRQRLSVLKLNHIFIYNIPHIERLSTEDIAILERLYRENGQSGTIGQDALDFVERTYAQLIKEYSPLTREPYPKGSRLIDGGTGWNPDSLAIVFAAPYRYDESGNYISDESELIYKREDWLVAELPKMRQQMMERVDVPVTLATSRSGDLWYLVFDEQSKNGAGSFLKRPNSPAA
jgi:hypothetical protein